MSVLRMPALAMGQLRRVRWSGRTLWVVGLVALALAARYELRHSRAQARLFSGVAKRLGYEVAPGPSAAAVFPPRGPYDERLGYSRLPQFLERLAGSEFAIDAQARVSPLQRRLTTGLGLFPTYHEKSRAGLRVLDREGRVLYNQPRPERVYESFEAIPPWVVATLLFIENRELLDPARPYKNPAVEWDRLASALLGKGFQFVRPEHRAHGGSTLATQIEKFRHSSGGYTASTGEKVRQVLSASLRAYLDGELTEDVRRQIIADYVNSIPLAAAPDYGEVQGLGDGLWVWYGADFAAVNRLLAPSDGVAADVPDHDADARALAYRQVLSLFLAQRRPSSYLLTEREALSRLTDQYLNLVCEAGLISEGMRDRAQGARATFRDRLPPVRAAAFAEQKASLAIRARVGSLLGLERMYDLDRLDLSVSSTIDGPAQAAVTAFLRRLRDPAAAAAAGLRAERMLERGDPGRVVYSFTLYERTEAGDALRVQADNFDQPLSINDGVKLELGSTAKLRTLATYLELVAALHERHAAASQAELRRGAAQAPDRITRWGLEWLVEADRRDLTSMLDAALDCRYSAAPGEFFTGGGRHAFSNFDPEDDRRVPTVREAFRKSINLPFIRLMRDIVDHEMTRVPGSSARILADAGEPARRAYLERFADREGREFLRRFWQKYRGKAGSDALQLLLDDVRPSPRRLSVAFRAVRPEASVEELAALLRARLPGSKLGPSTVRKLYDDEDPARRDLSDLGYLAGVHPLELWLVAYRIRHPDATLNELLEAGAAERQRVYGWLFRTRHKNAQDARIRRLLEVEAYLEIHRSWQRLGYPFESLVPSYATAIGSSADRPAALAELMGIILGGGLRQPAFRIQELRFAEGTPYEARLSRKPVAPERVMQSEVAAALAGELLGVVEQGTAGRARGALAVGGRGLPIGGKTGTGDNRQEVYGRRGQLLEARVINRTATFAFTIGDRFFGAITAYVPGAEAAQYGFTSSLAVQVFRQLAPALTSLVAAPRPPAPTVEPTPALQASIERR